MNRILFYIMFVSCVININISFAQQDPQFSHFMFTPVYHNPAYAGIENQTKATLLHRSQWLGYQGIDEGGAPTTQLFSMTHPLKMGSKDVNSGLGLFMVNDQLGPLKNFNLKLSYSYHIKLKIGGVLGMGARIGLFHQRIDASLLRPSQENDVVIQELQENGNSQLKPDMGAGIWYETSKYYAGISMSHVLTSKFDFKTDSVNSKLTRHFYFTGGYRFDVNGTLKLIPTGLVKTDFAETNFDLGLIASINDYTYWGGITFRQSITNKTVPKTGKQLIMDDVVFIIGMGFLKRTNSVSGKISKPLRVGYAFDLVTSGSAAKNPTSHEIFVSYVFPIKVKRNPPPLRTPRYRHDN